MEAPDTHYARRPDGVAIAYRVIGDGPVDMLFAPGFISHLDFLWSDPGFVHFVEGLASFGRVILYDKPGTGLSDPLPHAPALEQRARDMEIVLDAAGSRRAVLIGFSESGAAAVLYAAGRPERVRSLVLIATFARVPSLDERLEGISRDEIRRLQRQVTDVVEHWGEGRLVTLMAPSLDTPLNRRLWGRFERMSASPSMARALVEILYQIDVREVAPSVNVPALLIHLTDDPVPVVASRELAELLPDAHLVELPGDDHVFWGGDPEAVLTEVRHFVTGTREAAVPKRRLTTVLFTDIVDSTARAAAMGDREWSALLERHNALVSRAVTAFEGRVVKFLGDGALATLPGPAAAVRAADAVLAEAADQLGLTLRAGVHTGECETLGDDLAGLAVHIGARVSACAGPGEILVSGVVRELVAGSGLEFEPRGRRTLKGVPGEWALFATVRDGAEPSRRYATERVVSSLGDRAASVALRRAPGLVRAVARRTRRSAAA